MIDLLKKKFLYVGSYFFVALLIEFLGFNFMGLGVFPQYFWMDIIVIVIIAAFIFIVPSFTVEAIMIVAVLLVQAIITAVNHSLYVYQGNTIFGFEMLYYAGAAGEAFEVKFISIPFVIAMVACVAAEIAALLFLKRYRVKQDYKRSTVFSVLLIFSIAMFASSFGYSMSVDNLKTLPVYDENYRLNDELYLYENGVQKEKAIKKFGTYVFYLKQVENIMNETVRKNKSLTLASDYLSDTSKDYLAKTTPYTGALEGKNVISIMIETGEWYGIDEKLTPNLYAIKNQGVSAENYHSKDKTNHSEAIGLIGSYPLNCNMLSNLRDSAKSGADYYPFALASVLKRDGYTTQYFHSNDGAFYQRKEAMGGYGFENTYFREDMPDLREDGSVKKSFYDFSLDSRLFETNLERICNTEGGTRNFYSFITTLIMHGDYDDFVKYGDYAEKEVELKGGAEISDSERADRLAKYDVTQLKNYYLEINDFSDTMKNEWGVSFDSLTERYGKEAALTWYYRYKRYQAGVMDLDKGVGILLNYLKTNGLLEDTVILLYGDHNAYYNDQQYVMKQFKDAEGKWTALPQGSVWHTDYYKVAYMLYDGSMPLKVTDADGKTTFSNGGAAASGKTQALSTGYKIQRFTTVFDTVPTLLDLLGYRYDTRLYHGKSIFSDSSVPETALISRENGYLTDGIYTIYDNVFYVDDLPYVYDGEKAYKCTDVESAQHGSENYPDIAERIRVFNQAINVYLEKQESLELIYSTEFFVKGAQFDVADINKFIFKNSVKQ